MIDPGERFHDWLLVLCSIFHGESTIYIIDDCSASKALTKNRDMLSELAFIGCHADQSVWVLTQKYNSVLKDLHEQTHYFTARTATHSKTVYEKMMYFLFATKEQRLGSSYQKPSILRCC